METLVVGQMRTNCYIADGVIIDPGDDAEYIMAHVQNPRMIIATHGHFDHVMAAYALQLAYNIPFYMHPDDFFLLRHMQSSAKHFLGLKTVDPPPQPTAIPRSIRFIHTPGHTPGSICLPLGNSLVVGDTVFAGGAVGRTDFSYSDPIKLSDSLKKIRSHPKGTRILSGHGEEFRL